MTFNFGSTTEAQSPSTSLPSVAPHAGSSVRPSVGPALLPEEETKPRRRVLLVGQPNVGKSVVFGALTGTYVTVSNYPGTTVEITRGRATFGAEAWEVVDTPGTGHNLVPMSEDEAVTRDILVSAQHDTRWSKVGDAKNLVRTLLLALQLTRSSACRSASTSTCSTRPARPQGLSIDLDLPREGARRAGG